ncbi:Bromodomain [Macleaya cordata]|uniref:Bromodomain n=1 Tax=Macleaya cordata TaxID=56857 RepID=A0A200QVL8_MACCD|nr:Bromodomain [Macleaya cordata]
MASGPLVGGGGDGSREKHRWAESKVYTRKAHNKGPKTILPQPSSQTLAAEDGNSSQQQIVTRFDAASDDSSSLNRRQTAVPTNRDPPSGNGVVRPPPTVDNRITINLSSRSKQEMRELRKKLTTELEQVRNLVKKLEAKEAQFSGYTGGGGGGYSHSQMSANDALDNGGGAKRVNSEVGSAGPHNESRPLNQLSVSVFENSHGGVGDIVEKEKRTPKANQYYRNSEFLLGKDKFPPPESNKKSKSSGGKKHGGGEGYGFGSHKYSSQVFKSCSNLLGKLMKHKHGWVFNTPVDVKGLGLHDYYTIIKHPMDLGTVKSRLSKNWYKSPREFAEDVRLTFHNAMTYNPKGQDVHIMADQLSQIFEEKWAALQREYNLDSRFELDNEMGLPTPTSKRTSFPPPFPPEMRRTLDRSESMTLPHTDSRLKPSNSAPTGRIPAPKKPKAKDPDKRDMTYEEKQRLSTNLQSLPSEKLDNIVQIIKKRNSALCQHDDEIEVDIDSVDAETLWELDRFVTNYKKSLSKNKRKAELAIQAREEAQPSVANMDQASAPAPALVEAPKETRTDEKNMTSSSPVQGEKQGDNASRSSSSSSSSSDSGSSSSVIVLLHLKLDIHLGHEWLKFRLIVGWCGDGGADVGWFLFVGGVGVVACWWFSCGAVGGDMVAKMKVVTWWWGWVAVVIVVVVSMGYAYIVEERSVQVEIWIHAYT